MQPACLGSFTGTINPFNCNDDCHSISLYLIGFSFVSLKCLQMAVQFNVILVTGIREKVDLLREIRVDPWCLWRIRICPDLLLFPGTLRVHTSDRYRAPSRAVRHIRVR